MATYVTLYKFTDQGIRNVKDSPNRLQKAIEAGKKMGVKITGAYYTIGEYDLVIIAEAADEAAGVAHTLAIGALGNVRSTTLKAFSPAEFGEIIKKMG